jgi:drug/metabolite transporter (DMT)-like permease
MTRAYSLNAVARISALNYRGIIFTNTFAIPVFGDIRGVWQLVGTGLVVISGIFITLSAQNKDVCSMLHR